MIQTRTIGSHTEIYSDKNGGGKSETYITQSKTTVFHDFFTRKFLGEGETVEEFMEVSEAERDRLQGIRDAWVRPPQVFIDTWNDRCIYVSNSTKYKAGMYNEETGYFELNGILDIGYTEAYAIMSHQNPNQNMAARFAYNCMNIRTTFPILILDEVGLTSTFRGSLNIKKIVFHIGPQSFISSFPLTFHASSVEEIENFKIGKSFIDTNTFQHSKVKRLDLRLDRYTKTGTHNLRDLNLPLQDWQNMVARSATHGAMINIRVSASIYVMLTGDTTDPTVAAMDPAELQKWTELVPLAAEKNITFVA